MRFFGNLDANDRPRGDHQGHFSRATNDALGNPTPFYLGRLHYGAYYHLRAAFDGSGRWVTARDDRPDRRSFFSSVEMLPVFLLNPYGLPQHGNARPVFVPCGLFFQLDVFRQRKYANRLPIEVDVNGVFEELLVGEAMLNSTEQVQWPPGRRQQLMSRCGEVLASWLESSSRMSTKMCIELRERIEQCVDIVICALVDDIDVDGHHRRPLEHSGQGTDEYEVDVVVCECAKNLAKISPNRSAPSSAGRR